MEKGKLLGILSIVFAIISYPVGWILYLTIAVVFIKLSLPDWIGLSTAIISLFVFPIAGLILGIIALKKGSKKLGIVGCILNALIIIGLILGSLLFTSDV